VTRALIIFVADFNSIVYSACEMKYLSLPKSFPDEPAPLLPFFLAMEEYAARIVDDDGLFFMWQVDPTVIFGRNQVVENEVNIDYCRQHGIKMFRRKSGGGCVYADRGNIMFSCIQRSSDVTTTFAAYTSAVSAMLCRLGLNAEATGRNDILIDGLKVSGNAFYHLPHRSIVHGTMLFTTDNANMLQAITPSIEKLQSKGVASVRKHVTTLSEHLSIGIEEFKDFARASLTDDEVVLSDDAIKEIRVIEQTYLSPDFIFGRHRQSSFTQKERIENVGEITASVTTNRGLLTDIDLSGDFFLLSDLESCLFAPLRGVAYDEPSLREAIAKIGAGNVILNLTDKQLLNLIYPKQQ